MTADQHPRAVLTAAAPLAVEWLDASSEVLHGARQKILGKLEGQMGDDQGQVAVSLSGPEWDELQVTLGMASLVTLYAAHRIEAGRVSHNSRDLPPVPERYWRADPEQQNGQSLPQDGD